MRLIDADELRQKLMEKHYPEGAEDERISGVIEGLGRADLEIKHAPTIDPVHAAGGCYCCECVCCDRDGAIGYCNMMQHYTSMTGYCSHGGVTDEKQGKPAPPSGDDG